MKDPIDIEIKVSGMMTDKIEHFLYNVREQDKLSLLKDITIVENPDSCIIFCRTKDRVDTLCDELIDSGYSSDKIHGAWNKTIV